METSTRTGTRYLEVPGGRLAYDDTGTGPLVVCLPGLGDVRASYRFFAPRLVAAGFRVITMDLRGLGESSADWPDYRVTSVANDLLALLRAVDAGPAFLAGNSFTGGAVAYVAATAPELVAGIILLDAFVRDTPMTLVQRAGGWLLPRLGPRIWGMYFKTLYPSAPPADFDAYLATLKANLKERGRWAATVGMLQSGQAAIEPLLSDVRAPVLVVVGSKDPDFKNPAAEAATIAGLLRGAARTQVAVVDGAGHYPHAELPERTAAIVVDFLNGVCGERAGARHGA